MNPVERLLRKLDRVQRSHGAPAFVYGVVKKFGDDNAGTLVSSLTYSAFATLFPVLLLLVTLLGIVLGNDPGLRHRVLHSALAQFPVVGNDLARNIRALHNHSVVGLTVGIIGLVWGSLGFAQKSLFTMSQGWNLPDPERPNLPRRLAHSLAFLGVIATGAVIGAFLAGVVPSITGAGLLGIPAIALSTIVNCAEYVIAFRVLTAGSIETRRLLPGALVAGIGWTILLRLGGFLVDHFLRHDSALYGLFGIVLGLMAWIYLSMQLTVYSAEINVVLAHRLWPRSLVQPPMTEADERALAIERQFSP